MFDSYAHKARPYLGACSLLVTAGFMYLSFHEYLFAQESEVTSTEVSVPSPDASIAELKQEEVIVEDTNVSTDGTETTNEGEIGTVPLDERNEEESGEKEIVVEQVGTVDDIINIFSTTNTSTQEILDQNLTDEAYVQDVILDPVIAESSVLLEPVSERRNFSTSEPIAFTFTSAQPFILKGSDAEASLESESSFTDLVVDTITSAFDTVAESVTAVAEAIGDHIADAFAFIVGDTEDTEVYITPQESPDTVHVPDSLPNATQEEIQPSTTGESTNEGEQISSDVLLDTGDTVPEVEETEVVEVIQDLQSEEVSFSEDVSIRESDSALLQTTTTPTSAIVMEHRVQIDGVGVPFEVHVVDETELTVSLLTPALTPGEHHVSMQIVIGDTTYFWEGGIVWQGNVVREVALSDAYYAYVIQEEGRQSLWFFDMSQPGYEYVFLAEDEEYGSTTLISLVDTSIQWLSHDDHILNGYDILARTTSSQVLESNDEPVVFFESHPYEVVIDGPSLTFNELDLNEVDSSPNHELSF